MNRILSNKQLFNLMRHESPAFLSVAKVVGKWVRIRFDRKQPPFITAALSQLGFHWNRRRQIWQHPCGCFSTLANNDTPAISSKEPTL